MHQKMKSQGLARRGVPYIDAGGSTLLIVVLAKLLDNLTGQILQLTLQQQKEILCRAHVLDCWVLFWLRKGGGAAAFEFDGNLQRRHRRLMRKYTPPSQENRCKGMDFASAGVKVFW